MTSFYPALSVLYTPVKAFRSLPESSRLTWLVPFVLCGVLSILTTLGINPILQAILTNSLPVGADASQTGVAQSATAYVAPLGVVARWLIQAGFLWMLVQLVNTPVRFSTILTVVAYSFIVVSIGELLGVALIHYQGVENVTNPMVLYGDFGLNRLLPGTYTMAAEGMLRSITVFTVWHLALLTVGMTVLARLSAKRAFLVSFVTWAFPILLGAASFSFFDKIRSLTL